MVSHKQLVIFSVVFIIGIGMTLYQIHMTPDALEVVTNNTDIPTQYIAENPNTKSIRKVLIHISGAVNNPGLYDVPADLRVHEIFTYAGGLSSNANVDKINLAATVKDGKRYFVPAYTATQRKKSVKTSPSAAKKHAISFPININLATQKQLIRLPGIGKATAKAIVEERQKKGQFDQLSELKKVKGIGNSTFKKIESLITL